MRVEFPTELTPGHLHSFLYGYPGCGKTKYIGDFHEAGQSVVRVSTEKDLITLPARGLAIPTLVPADETELRAIVEVPQLVIERVLRKIPGLENYEVKTWAFDNLRGLQKLFFGVGGRTATPVFDGVIDLPATRNTGIMAKPNKRDSPECPANKDYRMLDDAMRAFVAHVMQMPYHTIITAHAERDFGIETRMTLAAKGGGDKDSKAGGISPDDITFSGYPSLDGFSLKYDLPGLVSDFYFYMETNGAQFFLLPRSQKGWFARTRLNQVFPQSIDWTEKNAYHILVDKFKAAQELAAGKKSQKR